MKFVPHPFIPKQILQNPLQSSPIHARQDNNTLEKWSPGDRTSLFFLRHAGCRIPNWGWDAKSGTTQLQKKYIKTTQTHRREWREVTLHNLNHVLAGVDRSAKNNFRVRQLWWRLRKQRFEVNEHMISHNQGTPQI